MEDNVCAERHKNIDKCLKILTQKVDKHDEMIDVINQDIVSQKKDTTHLQEAIKSLKDSIDLLITEISNLKAKPLEKYEKVAMVIITAIISYLVGSLLGR